MAVRVDRRRRSALAASLAALALLAAACLPRTVNEITDATPVVDIVAPRFVVDAAATRIERFDPPGAGAGIEVGLAAEVHNPNDFAIELERVEWTLRLAGRGVASGVLEPALRVDPGGASDLAWTVAASLAEARDLWASVVGTFAGRPLEYEVSGRLRFVSEVYAFTTGERTLFSGQLVARQKVRAPVLTLVADGHEVTAVRADAPVLRIALELTNPGEVGYFVSGRGLVVALAAPRGAADAGADVRAADVVEALEVGRVDMGPVPVPAGATVRTDLLVYVDPAGLAADAGARLAAALAGDAVPFRIEGAWAYDVLGVDSFPLPDDRPLLGLLRGAR